MPLNWRLAAAELRFILEHSEASALFCDGELLDLANEATAALGGLVRVVHGSNEYSRVGAGLRSGTMSAHPGVHMRWPTTSIG